MSEEIFKPTIDHRLLLDDIEERVRSIRDNEDEAYADFLEIHRLILAKIEILRDAIRKKVPL